MRTVVRSLNACTTLAGCGVIGAYIVHIDGNVATSALRAVGVDVEGAPPSTGFDGASIERQLQLLEGDPVMLAYVDEVERAMANRSARGLGASFVPMASDAS